MIFGTDGVRDIGGEGLLSPDSVDRLGQAIAGHMSRSGTAGGRVLIARDTRTSGPGIEQILTNALRREGCSTIHAGVLPTPAVSLLVSDGVADLGLVISASHNPPEFNGIKILDGAGSKLDSSQEEAISEDHGRHTGQPKASLEIEVEEGLGDRYLEKLMGSFPAGEFLQGLSVVLDCARGAACHWGPEAFQRAGAEVTVIHGEPDGERINVGCGSLHPEVLGEEVKRIGAAVGIALDGDADRALFCDESGTHVDGDDVIVIWARAMLEEGLLDPPIVALTVMSNAGVEEYLNRHGVSVVRTAVGDRAVAAALKESGGMLGGEPSGHIICPGEAATGDGIRTALAVARRVVQSGRPLSNLYSGIERFPQEQKTLKIQERPPLEQLSLLSVTMEQAQQALGSEGRILVRYSGTEPLLRILVEARSQSDAELWIERLERSAQAEEVLGVIPAST